MKPKPIILFDWLFWIALFASAASSAGEWWSFAQTNWASAELRNTLISGTIIGMVLMYGIPIWLWSLISLAGSNRARWIYAISVGFFLFLSILWPPSNLHLSFAVMAGLVVLNAMKIACLFVPGAAPWFFKDGEQVRVDARTFE